MSTVTGKLRLEKLAGGVEQVRPAVAKEAHLKRAEEAHAAYCGKLNCNKVIGTEPFVRVNDKLYHLTCTRTI